MQGWLAPPLPRPRIKPSGEPMRPEQEYLDTSGIEASSWLLGPPYALQQVLHCPCVNLQIVHQLTQPVPCRHGCSGVAPSVNRPALVLAGTACFRATSCSIRARQYRRAFLVPCSACRRLSRQFKGRWGNQHGSRQARAECSTAAQIWAVWQRLPSCCCTYSSARP